METGLRGLGYGTFEDLGNVEAEYGARALNSKVGYYYSLQEGNLVASWT
jgi:hypothetical protein